MSKQAPPGNKEAKSPSVIKPSPIPTPPSPVAVDFRLKNENTIYLSFSRLTVFPEKLWDEKDRGFPAEVLKTIDASCNSLQDISPKLLTFSNLQNLNLAMNHITKLSDEIGAFEHLQTLVIQNNQLKELPLSIARLTTLTNLNASHNALQHIPEQFSSLTALKHFNFANNELTEFPMFVLTLTKLTELVLMNNHLKSVPQDLSRLMCLDRLDLGSNHLTAIPSLSSTLRVLLLSSNHLTEIPSHFSLLQNLTTTDLGYNDLTEKTFHIEYFEKLPAKSVNVSGNNMVDFSHSVVVNKSIPPSTILVDELYLGNWESSRNKYLLQKMKITHILTVAHDIKPSHPDTFKYLVISIDDLPDVDIAKYFQQSNEWIHNAILGGGRVLIHCAAGISRSVTLTVAYLMRQKKFPFLDALTLVKKQRPIADPNRGFLKQLEVYQAQLEKERDACYLM